MSQSPIQFLTIFNNCQTATMWQRRKHKTILFKISQNPTLTDSPALKQSLFSNIPPTINFMLHNEMSSHQLHNDIRKHLKWKLSTITPAIVKRCARLEIFSTPIE